MNMQNPTTSVTSAIAKLRVTEKSLAESLELQKTKSARLAELVVAGDLNEDAVIDEISRLQVFEALFPKRIPLLEQAIRDGERAVNGASNEFISAHLGPLARKLKEQAHPKVTAQMRVLVPESELARAVENSLPMREIAALHLSHVSLERGPMHGTAISFAEQVLAMWEKAQALSAKQS